MQQGRTLGLVAWISGAGQRTSNRYSLTLPKVAAEVGKRLAAAAKKAGVETVVFDRGGYLYHGRVKSLAEGAREGGLKF